jgi:valyl-tRNA synthetase
MMMFGIEFTGIEPFHTVYLHGLILDENGQKMSKTKGNVVDPLEVMDSFGTDARFTLLVGSTPGNDTNLSLKKVESNRNFANKIWNAGRFVISALAQAPEKAEAKPEWTLPDSWIWARLNALLRDADRLFSTHQYGEAGRQIYEFFWGEYADWYLEIAKTQLAAGGDRAYYTASTLVRVLDAVLRLLHPFTPFVTEEIWQALKKSAVKHGMTPFRSTDTWEEALIIARWPEARLQEGWEKEAVAQFSLVQEVVRSIRNLRSEKKVPPSKKISVSIAAGKHADTLSEQRTTLQALANLDPVNLQIAEKPEAPKDAVALVVNTVEIFIPFATLEDTSVDPARVKKETETLQSQINRLEALLASDFAHKAPAALVEKERTKLFEYKESLEKLKNQF